MADNKIVEIVYQLVDKVSDPAKKMGDTLDGTGKAADTAGAGVDNFDKKAKPLPKTLGEITVSGLLAVGAFTKLAASFLGVMRESNALDKNLADIQNLTKQSAEEIAVLRKNIIKLSSDTGKSWDDLSKSYLDLVSSGVGAAHAMELVGVSAKLAKVGLTDTKTAADGLTTVINAFSLE